VAGRGPVVGLGHRCAVWVRTGCSNHFKRRSRLHGDGARDESQCNASSKRACYSVDMQRSGMHASARLSECTRTGALTLNLKSRVQASRTISAFTVVMVTIALLWYVGASSCTSFFFAFQGFLPMQARARGLARRPPARTESASTVVHRRHAPGGRRNATPAPLGASRARARGRARRPPARARLAPDGAGVTLRLAHDACLLCTPTSVGIFECVDLDLRVLSLDICLPPL